jgi:hypothetical protein
MVLRCGVPGVPVHPDVAVMCPTHPPCDAEHLVKHKYTRPDRLCIEGRSAGGLLMGAVTNMRPDLFLAVIMGVPFV